MGFIKRFLPFFAAFVFALFIVKAFHFGRDHRPYGQFRSYNQLIEENDRLKKQIDRLRPDVKVYELDDCDKKLLELYHAGKLNDFAKEQGHFVCSSANGDIDISLDTTVPTVPPPPIMPDTPGHK